MPDLKILCFAGSTRKQSLNVGLLKHMMGRVRSAGLHPVFLDLSLYDIPMFNGDLEEKEGRPAAIRSVRQMFMDSAGFLIATPEYNGFFTPLLKNILDWVSRPGEGEPPSAAFRGKPAVLLSASPGMGGGRRSVEHLRIQLGNLKMMVMEEALSLPGAHEAGVEYKKNLTPEMEVNFAGFAEKAQVFFREHARE